MERNALCMDCHALLSDQQPAKHDFLRPRSRIENFTIFKCDSCNAVLEQSEQPNHWQLLPKRIPTIDQRLLNAF